MYGEQNKYTVGPQNLVVTRQRSELAEQGPPILTVGASGRLTVVVSNTRFKFARVATPVGDGIALAEATLHAIKQSLARGKKRTTGDPSTKAELDAEAGLQA